MKLLLVWIFSIPTFALAQQKSALEERVLNSLKDARTSISANVQRMSESELRNVDSLLREAKELADGRSNRRPQPRVLNCSQGSAGYQQAFDTIRTLAYDLDGLNYSKAESTTFAQNWVTKYPCEVASEYARDIRRISKFSYSSDGFNSTSSEGGAYALQFIDRFCADKNLEAIFKQNFDYAYSSSGLSYNRADATVYAKSIMEKEVMRCENRFLNR